MNALPPGVHVDPHLSSALAGAILPAHTVAYAANRYRPRAGAREVVLTEDAQRCYRVYVIERPEGGERDWGAEGLPSTYWRHAEVYDLALAEQVAEDAAEELRDAGWIL